MSFFHYQNQQLYVEQLLVAELARQYGTPLYIYSQQAIIEQWQAYDRSFGEQSHLVCYAVKANSNLAILNQLAQQGSGFDIVSLGELERVLAAGGQANRIVFSGVAKTTAEIRRALEVGIHCFNVESLAELERISQIATEMQCQAPISLRINPDVDAKTHPYISTGLKENKFGISYAMALQAYQYAAQLPNLKLVGIDCHIGSQLTEVAPFLDAIKRIVQLIKQLQQHVIELQHLDVGGGLGVCYHDETPPTPQQLVQALLQQLQEVRDLTILIEPGRSIVANSGILVTQVEYLKHHEEHHFAIVDAGMNDLMRPALYQAWMVILPVQTNTTAPEYCYDVVGPVCESGDFLGKARTLALTQGDLLAVSGAGAYGFSMASNYNSRPRVAEVMVKQQQAYLIRQRETLTDLWRGEQLLPALTQ